MISLFQTWLRYSLDLKFLVYVSRNYLVSVKKIYLILKLRKLLLKIQL